MTQLIAEFFIFPINLLFMCHNKRYITNKYGKKILVKCGHCKACLQEKAIARANRIRAQVSPDGSHEMLFVTLTYKNKYIPYFDFDEFRSSDIYTIKKEDLDLMKYDDVLQYKRMKIYRDATPFYSRIDNNEDGSYSYKLNTKHKRVLLDTILIPYSDCCEGADFLSESHFKRLKYHKRYILKPRISVAYYKDIQNFFKRFRQILQRKYNIDGQSFKYYSCSEYGSNSNRSHFHLLIDKPFGQNHLWKAAIIEAWPFSDLRRFPRAIQLSRNAASYVSSYVNCDTTLPALFRNIKELRPKNSYSKGFGFALEQFSLPEVLKAVERGDIRYNVARLRDGALVVDSVLLPKYVVSNYFPKFKGFSRLTTNEIINVSYRPSELALYKERLGYEGDDLHNVTVMLYNQLRRVDKLGLDRWSYAQAYGRIWTMRASEVMKDFYNEIRCLTDYYTAYDNIEELYNCTVDSDLNQYYGWLPPNFAFPTDYNAFPKVLVRDLKLETCYDSFTKDKNVRNIVYSNCSYM